MMVRRSLAGTEWVGNPVVREPYYRPHCCRSRSRKVWIMLCVIDGGRRAQNQRKSRHLFAGGASIQASTHSSQSRNHSKNKREREKRQEAVLDPGACVPVGTFLTSQQLRLQQPGRRKSLWSGAPPLDSSVMVPFSAEEEVPWHGQVLLSSHGGMEGRPSSWSRCCGMRPVPLPIFGSWSLKTGNW